MEETSFSSQLWYSVNALTSPVGAVAVFCLVMLFIAMLMSPKLKWWALVGLMWCSVVGFYVKEHRPAALAFPLQEIRDHGRPLTTAFLAVLLLPALITPRGWRQRMVGLSVIAYFTFEMLLAVRITAAGIIDRGVVTSFIYILMFIVLGWGCAKWIHSWDDAHKFLRCLVATGVVNILATLYQLAVNRGAAIQANRLMGACGNPQEMAMVLAVTLPPACYLLARSAEPKFWRIVSGLAAGIQLMMLLWTGSRTGLLVAAIAIVITFWSRLAKFVAITLFIGIVAGVAFQIYGESTQTITGMFARGDNRTMIWRAMWEAFLSKPAFGIMDEAYGTGESSYLSVASQMGLFGLIPLFLFMVAAAWEILRLYRWRSHFGGEKLFIDMLAGGIVSLLVGGLFEAYLLGTLVVPVFALYAYLVLMTFAYDAVTTSEREASLLAHEPHSNGDDGFNPMAGVAGQPAGHYY